jgi:hypothetical protein
MTGSIFMALTNSVSAERDAEFNEWYNGVHSNDLLSLPTMRSMTRYRAVRQITPGGAEPSHQYLALYHLDDPEAAYRALVERRASFTMTDAIADPLLVSYAPIFSKSVGD